MADTAARFSLALQATFDAPAQWNFKFLGRPHNQNVEFAEFNDGHDDYATNSHAIQIEAEARYANRHAGHSFVAGSRPGTKPALDTAQKQKVIALACSPAPVGYARWTIRLLAAEVKAVEALDFH